MYSNILIQNQMEFNQLPYFIIIGAQKGGTSSLFYYLKQHSQLNLPNVKEIHFFDLNFNKGIDWYKQQFPQTSLSVKKTGEASPYYLFHPHVPERVFKCCPSVKLIVMLRNPIDRAYSHYMMQRKKWIEYLTFEKAFKSESKWIAKETMKLLENPAYQSKIHQKRSYFERGKYYTQIKKWLNYFPANQFLFVKSESFFDEPLQELSKVYSFLNIRYEHPENLSPQNVNEYKAMSPKMRSLLSVYYKQDIEKLSELLGDKYSWDIIGK